MKNYILKLVCIFGALFTAPFFASIDTKKLHEITEKTIRMHAFARNTSPEKYLKDLTRVLFGQTGFAYQMMTKKIVRSICKQHLADAQIPLIFFTNVRTDLEELIIKGHQNGILTTTKSNFHQTDGDKKNKPFSFASIEPVLVVGVIACVILTYLIFENHETLTKKLVNYQSSAQDQLRESKRNVDEVQKNILLLTQQIELLNRNSHELVARCDKIDSLAVDQEQSRASTIRQLNLFQDELSKLTVISEELDRKLIHINPRFAGTHSRHNLSYPHGPSYQEILGAQEDLPDEELPPEGLTTPPRRSSSGTTTSPGNILPLYVQHQYQRKPGALQCAIRDALISGVEKVFGPPTGK
jgi:hypothetical protein